MRPLALANSTSAQCAFSRSYVCPDAFAVCSRFVLALSALSRAEDRSSLCEKLVALHDRELTVRHVDPGPSPLTGSCKPKQSSYSNSAGRFLKNVRTNSKQEKQNEVTTETKPSEMSSHASLASCGRALPICARSAFSACQQFSRESSARQQIRCQRQSGGSAEARNRAT